MRTLILLLGALALSHAALHEADPDKQRCSEDGDCLAGECCARYGITGWVKYCRKLSLEGQPCGASILGGCPCTPEFTCVPYSWWKLPPKVGDGTCQRTGVEVSGPSEEGSGEDDFANIETW